MLTLRYYYYYFLKSTHYSKLQRLYWTLKFQTGSSSLNAALVTTATCDQSKNDSSRNRWVLVDCSDCFGR